MTETKKITTAIMFGLGMILLLAAITSFFVALLAKLTTISDSTLSIIIFVCAIISMAIAGIIAGIKAKGKGWIVGSLTGVSFTILVFLINYLGFSKGISSGGLLYHIGCIGASTMGGIIGVNTVKKG
ncbi:TIGR04086 family membrane protein [Ectobacillus polymachus]|uniref:TIGR04086 family membrane protein n=1 Tax=Ectobacillus polymachus TaxID=1508806 RepID=UPI003A864598